MAFCATIGFSAPALADAAQGQAQIIHIRGVVPEMRVLYVQSGELIKIGGNTTKNVTPTALDINTNQATEITDKLSQQYQLFLLVHNNHLEPGYYTVPKINVSQTSPSSRAMTTSILKLRV